MPTFGEQLREQRESREVSLDQIAQSTRISRTYLAALEQDDFDELPGDVFAKGYVRAYADFIGADAEGLVEAFVVERRARGGAAEAPAGGREYLEALRGAGAGLETRRTRAGYLVVAVSAAAVLVLAGLGYRWWTSGTTTAAPARQAPGVSRGPEIALESPAGPPVEPPARVEETAGPREPDPVPTGRSGASVGETTMARAAVAAPATGDADTDDVAPPAAPVPRDAPDTGSAEAGRISIPESGVGTAIVDRVLEGRGDRFPAGSRIHFWTRVVGAEPGERIRHVWIHEGQAVESIPLEIGAAHWRTYSRKTMYSTGEWAVEARDASGRLLARAEFTCEAAARR